MNLTLKRTPGIYVVGFMAAGKSTIGRHLAHRLGWSFFDTDEEIEAAEKMSIAEIFDGRGEAEFRRIEGEIVKQHVRWIEHGRPAVLALGGGAFAHTPTRELLVGNGISVWLDCPLETVTQRLDRQSHRPLARDRVKLEALYAARREAYQLADAHVAIESEILGLFGHRDLEVDDASRVARLRVAISHAIFESIARDHRATRRALLLMVAAATMFGCMAFAAKVASARLSGPEVAMVRFAIGLLPALVVPRYRRAAMHFQRLDLLFYRGFFGGIAVLLYFLAIEHTNAGVATLLNYTAPIWSGLFSVLFIGEDISAKVLIPLPIALLGVYLVIRAHSGDVSGFGRWELVGACSAVASGIAVTAMRAARRAENSWAVYAAFCLLGLFTTAPMGVYSWKTPIGREWIALIATGVLAMGAQLLLTFSLRWVDAMTVGVISQLAVLVAMLLGAWFLNESISAMAAAGAALSIGGVLGVTYITSLSKPTAAADEVVPEA